MADINTRRGPRFRSLDAVSPIVELSRSGKLMCRIGEYEHLRASHIRGPDSCKHKSDGTTPLPTELNASFKHHFSCYQQYRISLHPSAMCSYKIVGNDLKVLDCNDSTCMSSSSYREPVVKAGSRSSQVKSSKGSSGGGGGGGSSTNDGSKSKRKRSSSGTRK